MPPYRYFTVTQTRQVKVRSSEGLLDAVRKGSAAFDGERFVSRALSEVETGVSDILTEVKEVELNIRED